MFLGPVSKILWNGEISMKIKLKTIINNKKE